jgi:hypothetical protein
MTLPFSLPDWLPWWVPLIVLVPVLLYLLLFLVMPFSVFGLKGRLDLIEARLDEIQGEIRRLGPRLPEPTRYAGTETPPAFGRSAQPVRRPPPVEDLRERPAPRVDAPPPLRAEPPAQPRPRPPPDDGARRVEPRLDWPRS